MKQKILKSISITLLLGLFLSSNLFSQQTLTINSNSKSSILRYKNTNGAYEYEYNNNSDIGRENSTNSVNSNSDSDIYRSEHTFNLGAIPTNATISEVKLWYAVGTYMSTDDLYFKVTQTSGTNSYGDLWAEISSGDLIIDNIYYEGTTAISSATLKSKVEAARSSGVIYIGALSKNEDTNLSATTLELRLLVTYTVPITTVNLTAKNDMSGYYGGSIKVGIDAPPSATPKTSPYAMPNTNVGAIIHLEAVENQTYSNYNYIWNDSEAPSNKSEWKKVTTQGSDFFSYSQTETYEVEPGDADANLVGYLKKVCSVSVNHDCTEFDNLIANASSTSIVEQNSGSVSVPSPKSVNGKNYQFSYWTDNNSTSNPRTVTPTSHENYTALYKYPTHSNNSSSFTHNNQRKVVKTANGNLHMVYESMGHIWYEMSTDDGDTWTIMNNGAPIDDYGDLSKSPSVTLDYNNTDHFFLVYQEVYSTIGDNQIVVKRISETGTEVWTDNVDLVMSENSIDLEPVVACNYSNLLVVYRVEDNDIPGSSLGLNYTFYSRTGNPMVFTKQVIGGLITGTSSTSVNPALASRQYPSSASMYYLAWKQGSNIQFTKIGVVSNSSLTFSTIETPTSGSGNSNNYSPSITANGVYVYLSWRGKRKEYSSGGVSKVAAGGGGYVYVDRVNYRMRDYYGNWGTLKRYGSDVSNPSINSAGSDYMYCWSENSGSTNKFVSSDNTSVEYFSTNGEDLQAGNGLNNSGQMQAVSFNKTTLPYNFSPTALLSDIGLDKVESLVMKYGREGIVSVDGAEFTFTIGDVLLDGESIDFVSVTDSTVAENLTELNSYLKTNSFSITSGSELMMSVMFGVVDDSLARIKLTEEDYVNFKMELVDSKTKEVIGSFDNVTFTKGNVEQYANISYLLETDGIGNREVELRLVVDDNIGASYS